jgi:hypothetical protein
MVIFWCNVSTFQTQQTYIFDSLSAVFVPVLTTSATPATRPSTTMSPRSASGWPEWEEKKLLSWLDTYRELPWEARSDTYYEQHRVAGSVESLRGKKYHIMWKRRRTGARYLAYSRPPISMRMQAAYPFHMTTGGVDDES